MAYVVAKGKGTFEIRESRATSAGPRSRTLATFRELTPDVLQRAGERSSKPLDVAALQASAQRAGAPAAESASDRAAAKLLQEMSEGRPPRATLGRLLRDALAGAGREAAANAEAAVAWIGATPQRRGEALVDLLLLVDSLPPKRPADRRRFPRIESRPASG